MRRGLSALACALATALAAGCAAGAESLLPGPPVLHWYVGPDRVDAPTLAERCEDEAGGRYTVEVSRLPDDAADRRAELIGRLEARDPTIDLFSMDLSLSQELAAAQVLAPVPEDLKEPFAEDVAPAALEAATVDGLLVAAPWWFDPYLLWWRGATAERAGLDPTAPIAWDDLIEAAGRTGQPIGFDDTDGDALGAWLTTLLEAAGGMPLLDGVGRDARVGVDSPAGKRVADVVSSLSAARAGEGPSASAPAALARRGGFLLAPSSLVADGDVALVAADLQWAGFPVLDDDEDAVPAVGTALAVPLYAPRTDLSYDLVSCLTSSDSLAALMTSSGHSAADLGTYEVEAVQEGYPLTDVVLPALERAVTVPASAHWAQVRAALERAWLPFGAVGAGTPAASARDIAARLRGELP